MNDCVSTLVPLAVPPMSLYAESKLLISFAAALLALRTIHVF